LSTSGIDRDTHLNVADVLVRYATAVDTRDWNLFRTCFTDDCRIDYGEVGSWRGADEFTAAFQQIHDMCGHSLHRITNHVTWGDSRRVTARSYVDALVMMPDNKNGTRAAGYYDDELVHIDEGWRIAQRSYTMVYLEVLQPTAHQASA